MFNCWETVFPTRNDNFGTGNRDPSHGRSSRNISPSKFDFGFGSLAPWFDAAESK
jgi:hypothetical protein